MAPLAALLLPLLLTWMLVSCRTLQSEGMRPRQSTNTPPLVLNQVSYSSSVVTSGRAPGDRSGAEERLTCEVIGGQEVVKGSAPWVVSVQTTEYGGRMHMCGGVLITEHWVMTAAHCLTSATRHLMMVAGEHDLRHMEGTEQFRRVHHYVRHQHYDSFTRANDIGLAKLKEAFHKTDYINWIKYVPDASYENEECLVLGWGPLSQGGQLLSDLSSVNQTIYPYSTCYYSYPNLFVTGMMCAVGDEPGAGPCQSDFGGPLVCRGDQLTGIASWSGVCGSTADRPAVYSNVTYYQDWVHGIINSWPHEDHEET